MGLIINVVTFITVLIASILYFKMKLMFKFPERPQIDDIWWGPIDPSKADTTIQPFEIKISYDILKDLENRLTNHLPFQPALEDAKQHYGINTKLLNTIVEFWKTKYNWTEREKYLNKFPQFKVNIQGLNIHYIHVKPKVTQGVKVLPLLLAHGWPGSVREFYEIIPILTAPQKGKNFVFEVIAPSLPGYGFSDAPVRRGLNIFHIGNIFKNLMSTLGFKQYYIQGGDWGATIVQAMATMYPDQVKGMHSNWCMVGGALQMIKTIIGSHFPSLIGIPKHQQKYVYPLSEKLSFLMLETGYFHIQATKPDTLGVALQDSPIGLAAYLLEKFIVATNPAWRDLDDGGLTQKYTYTDLLDNVMIYWVTRSATTSLRLYAESLSKSSLKQGLTRLPVEIPSACARFSHEVIYYPDVILKDRFLNLVHIADYEGGHFAAFELPDVLAKDIFQFVEKVEKLETENRNNE